LFLFTNYFAILDMKNSRNNRENHAQREKTQVEAADASENI
jgi:hypothetical protein